MRVSIMLLCLALICGAVILAAQEKPAAAPAAPPPATATASPAAPIPTFIFDHTFDQDADGWIGMGTTAKARIASTDVHAGKGALAFDYEVGKGQMNALVHPVSGTAFRTMDKIRFWIKTDTATNVAVVLQEKDEGRYMAAFWSAKDTWQEIELSPNEFSLSQDANDPKDPDARLDLEKVEMIGILDVGQAFAQIAENTTVPLLLDRRTGKRTLLVDDFRALAGAGGSARSKSVVDDFAGTVVKWVALGGTPLAVSAENPTGGRAMEVTYDAGEKIVVISRTAAHVDLTEAKTISFQVATVQPATIAITLETRKPGQTEGTRYSYMVETLGDRKPTKTTASLSSFEWDEDSFDPGEPMNLANLKSVSVVDVAGAMGSSAKNTLWVGPIKAN